MSERSEMKQWLIEDSAVRELLLANGFVCKKETAKHAGPGIHFYTQTQEQIDNDKWYWTDCKIEWYQSKTLSDGSVIASKGTRLVLLQGKDA